MFFVEMQNHLIRRVDAKTKRISTIAGTGAAGFSGDGGQATSATMRNPHSIGLDGAGGLYVADIGNNRIRRIDLKTGKIETFAGTGEKRPTPDGSTIAGTPLNGPRAVDFGTNGEMFLALREGNAVFQIDSKEKKFRHLGGTGTAGIAGDGGPALAAQLNGPKGIAVGPHGDLYIADTENHAIRVIRAATQKIETLVGDGTAGDGPDGDPKKCRLQRPHGVYVNARGDVYIGDSSNHKVRKFIVE